LLSSLGYELDRNDQYIGRDVSIEIKEVAVNEGGSVDSDIYIVRTRIGFIDSFGGGAGEKDG
jgi:hypothetical protein